MKKDRSNQLPKARQEQLIVKDLPDEVLVYDLARDKAHCLNRTAALVWKNCDGNSSITEINASIAKELGAPVDERIVWLALDQLEKFHLLAETPTAPAVFQGLNRRQLIRTLGLAAAAVPVIMSMSVPAAAQGGSCRASGVACGSPNQCCSNTCCVTGVNPGCPNNTCL